MSRVKLGSNDLLEYNAEFSVLICRDCEYAIQKSAVQSHLLRHKIYRGERHKLLESIAQFELRDPDDVIPPSPNTRPISALPVLDGYRCLHDGCSNLCASVKRMRRHWADAHGGAEDFEAMVREVKMQTFFRGTKIRYFEVSPEQFDDMVDDSPISEEEGLLEESEEELLEESEEEASAAEESHDEHNSGTEESDEEMEDASPDDVSLDQTPPRIPPDFELATLKTFHHFLFTTSLTLPIQDFDAQIHRYWTDSVLPLAFSRPWLMSGILAMSEYHTSVLTDDDTFSTAHRERGLYFFAKFVSGREEASRHVCGAVLTPEKEEERHVGGQLMCILRCAHWALTTNPMLAQRFTSYPFKLQNLITILKSFSLVERSESDGSPDEVFASANRFLRARCTDTGKEKEFALLGRLVELPSRMSDVFGGPGSMKDVTATLAAIASLVEHYSATFASERGTPSHTAVWHSMVHWINNIPDHFRTMVFRNDPAALVVVAFWASGLVLRAEYSGYWFLRSLPKRLLSEIANRLRSSGVPAFSLIEGLVPVDFAVLPTF
ncbi:hypothetical protein BU23DRAFT_590532 [Bimuria novae-zelandiae CBS 107.79]|uniref:C2H2-type domain-containing protein n=1 Tax=Bimuria novae-zelandiae CBS 107.79 TaxID=1447943 RepID=A0A6A5V2X8_9PLEO|nr:hypothetical protein BU23DRAFT_590532 [Bimuria novae-zelandiae CBS 107.79]